MTNLCQFFINLNFEIKYNRFLSKYCATMAAFENKIVDTMRASMLVDPDELENIYKSTIKKRTKLLHVKNVNEKKSIVPKICCCCNRIIMWNNWGVTR